MRLAALPAVTALLLAACTDAPSGLRPPVSTSLSVAAGDSLGYGSDITPPRIVPTVAMAASARVPRTSAAPGPIVYHAPGRIIPQPKVATIYWSNSVVYPGGPGPGTSGVGTGDGSVVGGFLRSLGGSSYWSVLNDYTDNVGALHRVANSLNYTRFLANNIGAPAPGAVVSDASIRTMLKSVVGTANLPFDQQTIYVVFSGTTVNLGGGFGTTYCAYHGFFARPNNPGQWILYAVVPYAADQVAACTAINTPGTGSPNDFASDATVNLLAATLDGAYTDPGANAWFDAGGLENSAMCAWQFTPTFTAANGSTANVMLGGKDYLIQQNWRIGPNVGSQLGCSLSGNVPLISLAPTTLTFSAIQNQGNPSSHFSTITNGGGGTLSGLSLGVVTYGPGATGWLQVPVLSAPTANPSATVTVQPTTGALGAGSYTATIPILSTVASNSPQKLTVVFNVAPAVASVTVAPSSATVGVGATQQLTATLRDANGNILTGRLVQWSSPNPAIASVSSTGLVTAVSAGGPINISATSEGVSGTSAITVASGGVTSVVVTPSSGSLRSSTPGFGWTQQLAAVVNGPPGVDQSVTWASGNSNIASVSASGLVVANAAGQTQITATSVADPTKSGTYDVTVIDGCTNIMPVPVGYMMPTTFLCVSGKDTYSYTAPVNTWVQLEAAMFAQNGCGAFFTPFEYVVGILSTSRAYSRSCSLTQTAFAFVRAGQNRFNLQKGTNPFAFQYFYTGARLTTISGLPVCTPFSSDYGVTFSVNLTVSCTSHLALLAARTGSVGISATSATMAVTIDFINNSSGAVVATATSAGPGGTATIPLQATALADAYNLRILPAIAGSTGTITVTISP
ncbi:MAG: Ig-like domain-containing protein [Gemmatimonadaceae bacterium]